MNRLRGQRKDLKRYGKFANRSNFKITHNDGGIEYVEVKGFETEVWRLKWKLFEALIREIDPGAEITVYK